MKKFLTACLAFTAIAIPASAKTYSLGIRASSLGIQGEVGAELTQDIALRFQGGGYHHYQKSFNFDNVHYQNVRIIPVNFNFIFDWYFWKTGRNHGFRLSPGVGINFNRVRLEKDFTSLPGAVFGKPANPYSGAAIGILKARYRYNHFTPLVMIGYDSPLLGSSKFFLSLDVGAYFQGEVKVRARGTGLAKDDPTFKKDIKYSAKKLLNDHWWVKTYPIISLAIKYKI